MSSPSIVRCSQCGQMNRIPEHKTEGFPICGKCRAVLIPSSAPPAGVSRPKSVGFMKKNLAWIVLLGIIGAAYYASTRPTPQRAFQPVRRQQASFPHPQQPLPYSGSERRFTGAEAVAPFEIKAAQGSHYLLKLVDAYTDSPVLTVFVQSGSTVEVEVPLGTYEVRYASGDTWYGYEHLFGPDTSYSKADKTFTFEVVENQISGFTITLYRVAHGNLRTSAIKETEF
jgi:hypothetical protein